MYRTILNDKIGNLLSYLTLKNSSLSLTKALKLLYLIDEISVLESGSPITFLDYKVWENGPVAHELYDELKYGRKIVQGTIEYSLDEFIDVIKIHNTSRLQEEVFLKNKSIPDLSEFCEVEIRHKFPIPFSSSEGIIMELGLLCAARCSLELSCLNLNE